jgi:hypothetical protein
VIPFVLSEDRFKGFFWPKFRRADIGPAGGQPRIHRIAEVLRAPRRAASSLSSSVERIEGTADRHMPVHSTAANPELLLNLF